MVAGWLWSSLKSRAGYNGTRTVSCLRSTTLLEFQISAMTYYVNLAVVIQPSGLIFVHL